MQAVTILTIIQAAEAAIASAGPFIDLAKTAAAGGTVTQADMDAAAGKRDAILAKLDADIAAQKQG